MTVSVESWLFSLRLKRQQSVVVVVWACLNRHWPKPLAMEDLGFSKYCSLSCDLNLKHREPLFRSQRKWPVSRMPKYLGASKSGAVVLGLGSHPTATLRYRLSH